MVRAQVGALLGPLLPHDLDGDLAARAVVAAAEELGRLMLADPEAHTRPTGWPASRRRC